MEKAKAICLSILTMILVVTLVSNVPLAASSKGPREGNLVISFYGNLGAAYGALAAGSIDLVAGMGWSSALDLPDGGGLADGATYTAAVANPSVVLAPVAAANTYELDLNNNATINTYPGIRSPMNYTEMRQAIAWLTDKDFFVGKARTYTLTIWPNQVGSFTQWTPNLLGTSNWECVDEMMPNGNGDFVSVVTKDLTDSYELEDLGNRGGDILDVTVVINAKTAVNASITIAVVVGGIKFDGYTYPLTTEYQDYESSWSTNPQTGSSWTWSDIDTLEAGFSSVKEGSLADVWTVTQLKVKVRHKVQGINPFAQRIDQMIAAPYSGWANKSMSYPNYPYEYDPSLLAAAAILDTRFPLNTSQPNPFYDKAVFPGSSPYLRNYPVDHAKANNVLDPLIVCSRSDDTRWTMIAPMIVQNMRTQGIPVTQIPGSGNILRPRVMDQMDYHLYTGSWTAGRFPPVTLYDLYHSINAFPYGRNYVTGALFPFVGDNATDPRLYRGHPKLDQYLYAANYAITYSDAVTNTKLAAGYMTEICVNVPLWSDVSYCAYSNKLLGVVNMECYGPINPFTFMNAYKTDGTPIRIGLISAPNMLNIVYSEWMNDYICLDRMNLYGGIDVPPYNLAADQPGFVKDWLTTTWDGGTKTLVEQAYRSDGYFCTPVTGVQGANVDAYTYYKNAWYDYQIGDGWFSTGFVDLDHVNIVSQYTSEIYFTTLSYWNTYYCQGPLRPMDNWATHPELVTVNTESIELTAPDTPGAITLAANPFWFVSVSFEGTPLDLGTEYNIVRGSLYIYNALGAGTLDVEYWAPGDARGFTPGNLAWQTILEGAGMYYCTAFTYGAGGSMTLRRSPFYFMETPPLGEIDFVRKPNGACTIDIADLALAGGAFGSQGTGVPSSNWFPGADLAPSVGAINIYDAATITGVNWLEEYDHPQ